MNDINSDIKRRDRRTLIVVSIVAFIVSLSMIVCLEEKAREWNGFLFFSCFVGSFVTLMSIMVGILIGVFGRFPGKQ